MPPARSCTRCAASPPRWSTGCRAATTSRPMPRIARWSGAMLARMHRPAADFALHQPNLRGLAWWAETVPVVLPFLDARAALRCSASELAFQQAAGRLAGVRRAAARADPRRPVPRQRDVRRRPDGDRLTGFFDFYFAGVDTLPVRHRGVPERLVHRPGHRPPRRGRAPQRSSPPTPASARSAAASAALLPALMRAGALRFWISRLWDLHLPRDASVLTAHDPDHFERVLRERIATPMAHPETQEVQPPAKAWPGCARASRRWRADRCRSSASFAASSSRWRCRSASPGC